MFNRKNGLIVSLSIMGIFGVSGGVLAFEEIKEKEAIVETQKESLSNLEQEKKELMKEKQLKEEEVSKTTEELNKTQETLSNKEKDIQEKEKDIQEKLKTIEQKDSTIKEKESEIEKLKKDLSAKIEAKREKDRLKKEVVVASAAPTSSVVEKESSTSPSRSNSNEIQGKTFYVEATAYVALCDTGCTGITATGINLLKNPNLKVIAVDPSVIPLGSKVYVEGYGHAIAGDTGGAIKGNKIDLYMKNLSDAIAYGRQQVKITVLD